MTGPENDGTWDDDDRAIARALGADAPARRAAGVDAEALAEYEAVLSHLPFAEIPPAAELEDRVIAAALAKRPAAARAIESAPSARIARRSAAPRWIAAGAALAAAAAIVVVLAVGQSGNGPSAPGARIEPAAANGLAHVLGERGTRAGVLRTGTGATAARVALAPDGQGYLYDVVPVQSSNAPWLWLDTSSGPVRVGRLAGPADVHFVVRGAVDAVKGAFLTSESTAGTPATPGPVTSRAVFGVS